MSSFRKEPSFSLPGSILGTWEEPGEVTLHRGKGGGIGGRSLTSSRTLGK